MANEFDDMVEAARWNRTGGMAGSADTRREVPAARLVSRLYRAAEPALRERLLKCLLRPLGPLAMAGIAAGAFGRFLYMRGASSANAAMDDVARFSTEQISELARFVEQVSPEALREFVRVLTENPVGVATFSAAATVLLVRKLKGTGAGHQAWSRAIGRNDQEQ